MARMLDGRAAAAQIKAELRQRVARLKERGVTPGLGTILVGDDLPSHKYVDLKHRDCAEVGIASIRRDLPASASEAEVRGVIRELNEDPACTGYILQLPLPDGMAEASIIEDIDPTKDADGLHPMNLGRLALTANQPIGTPVGCTPAGILELLRRHGISLRGKRVAVVGQGVTAGRPLGLLLSRKEVGATVTLCRSTTENLHRILMESDVIVAAVGRAHLVGPEDVPEGAVLVDVGVTRTRDADGKWHTIGDIDPASWEKASWATPNPGGVGPMTRVMLLDNVVRMAERRLAA